MQKHTSQIAAFTLIELSIVLVIIGLIVSGVIGARDMIQTAELRRFVTLLEKFDAAANTFQAKYGELPGDIFPNRSVQFNLESSGAAGTDGLSDGDGVLENGGVDANKSGIGGENTLFWDHLSAAKLIPYDISGPTGSVAVNIPNEETMRTYIPYDRVREIMDYHVHSDLSRHYYYLAAITGAAAVTGVPVEDDGLEVLSAERIDGKIDDGLPFTGIATARDDLYTPATAAPAAPGVCVDSATNLYNLHEDYRDVIACRIRVRASF